MATTALTPEFILTFCVFLVALAGVAWMAILERKPKDSLNPRLLPTTPIMLVAGFVSLLALIHVVNLLGVHTGR